MQRKARCVFLSTLLSRRAALLAAIGFVFNRADVEALTCKQKCKKEDDKEKKKKCLKKCKKKAAQPPPRQPVQMSGFGPGISASFFMTAGRYIATASISTTDTDNFIISLHGPNSDWDLAVNEIPEHPGSYQYQRVVEPWYSGTHFLEIEEAAGSWSILFSPA